MSCRHGANSEWAYGMTVDQAHVISDDELCDIAMAADPDIVLADDAVPFEADPTSNSGLLPAWYMAAPRNFERTPARMFAAVSFVVALIVLNGAGLCVTYGLPEIAW
jgi:hypothetical protein